MFKIGPRNSQLTLCCGGEAFLFNEVIQIDPRAHHNLIFRAVTVADKADRTENPLERNNRFVATRHAESDTRWRGEFVCHNGIPPPPNLGVGLNLTDICVEDMLLEQYVCCINALKVFAFNTNKLVGVIAFVSNLTRKPRGTELFVDARKNTLCKNRGNVFGAGVRRGVRTPTACAYTDVQISNCICANIARSPAVG